MHTQEDLNNLAVSFQEFKQIYARNAPIPTAELERIVREFVKRLTKVYGAKEGESIFEDTCERIITFYGPRKTLDPYSLVHREDIPDEDGISDMMRCSARMKFAEQMAREKRKFMRNNLVYGFVAGVILAWLIYQLLA